MNQNWKEKFGLNRVVTEKDVHKFIRKVCEAKDIFKF